MSYRRGRPRPPEGIAMLLLSAPATLELPPLGEALPAPAGLPLDAWKDSSGVHLEFTVAGLPASALEVSVEGKALTVVANYSPPERKGEALVSERFHGRATRTLTFGATVDLPAFRATLAAGVLTVVIPFK